MSLEVAAKHLAAHGRHGDSTLVHMNHKEVAGLQALARSKGKSLTINPRTGLPEAFNLRQELGNATSGIGATVTGAALAIAFPELVAAQWAIPAIVGGTNYVATGGKDPTRSVMGGVGAYGGQNIAGNVMQSGASTISENANTAAQAAAEEGASEEAQQAIVDNALGQPTGWNNAVQGAQNFINAPSIAALGGYKVLGAAALPGIMDAARPKALPTTAQKPQMIRPYKFDYNAQNPNNPLNASYVPGQDTSERKFFAPTMVPQTPYQAADGGIIALAGGGMPVEQMSNQAMMGVNTMYPMANISTSSYGTPDQMAEGGLSDLGGYSDGGRLLRGPGDGVSDSIPAQIGNNQPARLADGEFVVPARIVSELGNGSTEAGAKQLYKMLDRVQRARGKTTGKNKVAHNTNAAKLLPA